MVISCLKVNVVLHYVPMEVSGKKRRGRTAVKGAKIKRDVFDENLLLVVCEDKEKRVRCEVW